MQRKTKAINFGRIDHFLYVRINSVCADLDLSYKDFIEQSYLHLVKLIDERGITHFEVLAQEYNKYVEFREQTRYAPRMIIERHPFVVGDIGGEIYDHLMIIKDEHNFPWINILRILLMVMELEMDKMDEEEQKQGLAYEDHVMIADLFRDIRPEYDPESYQIKKTNKRREYEKKIGYYGKREGFRMLDE